MTCYLRFVTRTDDNVSIATVAELLCDADGAFTIEQGSLYVDGAEIGALDVTRKNDEVFDGDLDFLVRQSRVLGRKRDVTQALLEASVMIVLQVTLVPDISANVENALRTLWRILGNRYGGLLVVEGGGIQVFTAQPQKGPEGPGESKSE